MSELLTLLQEPELEFGLGQTATLPHDGLALFGPYDRNRSHHPGSLSFGLIGTDSGIATARNFLSAIDRPVENELEKERLWPLFPGFQAAFESALPSPAFVTKLDDARLELAARHTERHQRTAGVTDQYVEALQKNAERDERVQLAICVVPDFVYENCRPESRVANPVGERLTTSERKDMRRGQTSLFSDVDPLIYQRSEDFRRQLKARVMELDVPVQIIRESTLALVPPTERGARGLTPLSDRAWNLGVALYYKAGAKPWRIKTARRGVCYIGLAYRRQGRGGRTACCAAQLFVDSGDGVVFRGQFGPWWSEERSEFHLNQDAAAGLLSGVLETYRANYDEPLNEIFIHARSGFDHAEWDGFKSVAPNCTKLVGVRVRSNDRLRLLRPGRMPVMRGAFLKIDSRHGYLWGTGYKPRLATYDGTEVPVPLEIGIQRGDADIQEVAHDIFGLTKLNYNACRLGDTQPVTIKFSDYVGEILVSNPRLQKPKPQFRFYI